MRIIKRNGMYDTPTLTVLDEDSYSYLIVEHLEPSELDVFRDISVDYLVLDEMYVKGVDVQTIMLPQNLKVLQVRFNVIQVFQMSLSPTLAELYLDGNELTTLDNIVFPESLQILSVTDNKLTSIDNVEFPPNLHTLYLRNNKITSIDNVKFPSSLLVLNVNHNRLTHINNDIMYKPYFSCYCSINPMEPATRQVHLNGQYIEEHKVGEEYNIPVGHDQVAVWIYYKVHIDPSLTFTARKIAVMWKM